MDLLLDPRRFLETRRFGRARQVGLDLGEACPLDHRADVVENPAGDDAGAHGGEHMHDQSAARGAEKKCVFEPESGHARQEVVGFGQYRVVVLRLCPFGAAAAAIVEGHDTARRFAVAHERQGQIMEVAGVSGQARQADQRQPAQGPGRCAAVIAGVQPQAVGCGEEHILVGITGTRSGRLGHRCVHGRLPKHCATLSYARPRAGKRPPIPGGADLQVRPNRRSEAMSAGWPRRAL